MPQPRPISNEETGAVFGSAKKGITQSLASRTGAVFNSVTTAIVAPVSSTLLVNIIMPPANKEYFVKGQIMVLNTLNGRAPSVLAASSSSMGILSMAADIDLTK